MVQDEGAYHPGSRLLGTIQIERAAHRISSRLEGNPVRVGISRKVQAVWHIQHSFNMNEYLQVELCGTVGTEE